MRISLLLTGLLHFSGISASAQQHTAAFSRWEPSAISPTPSHASATPTNDTASKGDYRYEGLAFGGLAFGALGAGSGHNSRASVRWCRGHRATPTNSSRLSRWVCWVRQQAGELVT
jgi:hypothetical protein